MSDSTIEATRRPSAEILATHLEATKAINRVADWCDRHAHLFDMMSADELGQVNVWSTIESHDELSAAAVELVDLADAAAISRVDSWTSYTCGPVELTIFAPRELCQRVQVGTKTVTRLAPDAPTIEVEEPVYEWRCAAPGAEAVAG